MIPDYQSLMLPVLRYAADGKEHRIGDIIEPLGKQLSLTPEEMNEMLPSGRQPIFNNRVHWAKTYLAQAKLLEITRRAYFRITDRGRQVLDKKPDKITNDVLGQFEDFNEFKRRSRESQQSEASAEPVIAPIQAPLLTPDELLRTTIAEIDKALSQDLLNRIRNAPPAFFEELIVALLLRMGYGGSREEAGRAVGKSGDDGIDGVIDQDRLGLDRVYLQAKRYKADNPVTAPHIQAFSGSLGVHKTNKGGFRHDILFH